MLFDKTSVTGEKWSYRATRSSQRFTWTLPGYTSI